MRVIAAKDGQLIGEPRVFDTPQDFVVGMDALITNARELAGTEEIESLVGGIAGTLNKTKEVLVSAPHLTDWVGRQLVGEIRRLAPAATIKFENDAALGGLGEAVYGAGKNFNLAAYLTVSTGVGGARIINQKVDSTMLGFEPGHQIIDLTNNLTLEQLVSGTAVKARYGRPPKEIEDEAIWDKIAHDLAIGLHNIAVMWSPEVIVLGGPMITGQVCIPLDKTVQYLKQIHLIFPTLPEIKKSELGDKCTLYGALELLGQETEK